MRPIILNQSLCAHPGQRGRAIAVQRFDVRKRDDVMQRAVGPALTGRLAFP